MSDKGAVACAWCGEIITESHYHSDGDARPRHAPGSGCQENRLPCDCNRETGLVEPTAEQAMSEFMNAKLAFMGAGQKTAWGRWHFHRCLVVLEFVDAKGAVIFQLDLEELSTPEAILRETARLCRKPWCSSIDLGHLVEALHDLSPQLENPTFSADGVRQQTDWELETRGRPCHPGSPCPNSQDRE